MPGHWWFSYLSMQYRFSGPSAVLEMQRAGLPPRGRLCAELPSLPRMCSKVELDFAMTLDLAFFFCIGSRNEKWLAGGGGVSVLGEILRI